MRLIISSTSVSSTVTVNFAFWVEPFEANERFPELAPFGAFDEISSVAPFTNSEGIATGSGCGTRQSAIISGAGQYCLCGAK